MRRKEGWDVIFVRDTAKADRPLEDFKTNPLASKNIIDRLNLYNESFCNLLLTNGPGALMMFTDIPFLDFIPLNNIGNYWMNRPEWWKRSCGIMPPHEQFPWFNKNQKISWNIDTLYNIEEAWKEYLELVLEPDSQPALQALG